MFITRPGVAETEYEMVCREILSTSTALTSPFCLRSSPVSAKGHWLCNHPLPLPMDFPTWSFDELSGDFIAHVRFTWIEGVWDDSYSFHFLVFLSPNH